MYGKLSLMACRGMPCSRLLARAVCSTSQRLPQGVAERTSRLSLEDVRASRRQVSTGLSETSGVSEGGMPPSVAREMTYLSRQEFGVRVDGQPLLHCDVTGLSSITSLSGIDYMMPVRRDEDATSAVRRPEEDLEDVVTLPDIADVDTVRSICRSRVPGWAALDPDKIKVDQLCEGLSNQNFKVSLDLLEDEKQRYIPCVLFRVYGKGANKLYDPEVEQSIVMMLARYGIGPNIYARDLSWRIESWHFSVPLPNRSMRNPAIWVQMAAHMGRLHKLSSRPDFPPDIKKLPLNSATRLDTWASECMTSAAEMSLDQDGKARLRDLPIDEMLEECAFLKTFLVEDDPKIGGSGLDVVFTHWDAQENNVLQTLYGLRFIDFEYAGMDYAAFDIASYFVECTIDYLVPEYPFYRTTLSDFPTDKEMQLFAAIYLSEFLETKIVVGDLAVDALLERVRRFTLASHLLWSLWSVIRAVQQPTFEYGGDGGFDYLHYAKSRWFMYKWSKRAILRVRSRDTSGN